LPVPLPEYNYNAQYSLNVNGGNPLPNFVGPWEQIMAMGVFIACGSDRYKTGLWKELRYGEAGVVNTFYPAVRAISSATFLTLCIHWYQSYQSNQSDAGATNTGTTSITQTKAPLANETSNCQMIWSLFYLVTSALCSRFYRNCVVYANMPLLAGYAPTTGVLMPQFMYQSKAVQALRIPASMAAAIAGLGVTIRDFKMTVPVSDFNSTTQIPFPALADNALGPVAWSGFGFTTAPDTTFPYSNILTTPVGPGLVGGSLNIQLGSQPPLIIGSSYMGTNYGFNVATNIMFPLFLTGPFPAMVETLFTQFCSSKNNTENYTKLMVRVPQKLLGDIRVMDTYIFLSNAAGNVQPTIPNGLQNTGPAGSSQAPYFVRAQLASIASPAPLGTATAMKDLSQGLFSQNDNVYEDDATRREYKLCKIALLAGTAIPSSIAQDTPNGRFAAVFPSGSSVAVAIDSLVQETSAPNSSFGKLIEKQLEHQPRPGAIYKKKFDKLLDNADFLKFYEAACGRAGRGVLTNEDHQCPTIDPKLLGKGFPKGIKWNAAACMAKLSCDHNVIAQGKETVKDPPKKHDKLKRDIGKVVNEGVKVIKSGTHDMVDKAKGLAKDFAGDAMSLLG